MTNILGLLWALFFSVVDIVTNFLSIVGITITTIINTQLLLKWLFKLDNHNSYEIYVLLFFPVIILMLWLRGKIAHFWLNTLKKYFPRTYHWLYLAESYTEKEKLEGLINEIGEE